VPSALRKFVVPPPDKGTIPAAAVPKLGRKVAGMAFVALYGVPHVDPVELAIPAAGYTMPPPVKLQVVPVQEPAPPLKVNVNGPGLLLMLETPVRGMVQPVPRAHEVELIVTEEFASAVLGMGPGTAEIEAEPVGLSTCGTSQVGQLAGSAVILVTPPLLIVAQVPSFIRAHGLEPENRPLMSVPVAFRAEDVLRLQTTPGDDGNVACPPPGPEREKL
jgi:hypothetical protein